MIGSGSHGQVYKATDLETYEMVAVKVMKNIPKNTTKFEREIRLMD